MASKELVHRRGVLLESEQRPTDDAGQTPVSVRLLLAFTRALIRETGCHSKLTLAMYAARAEADASDEEMEVFLEAVAGEASRNPYPKGFF